MAIPDPAPGVTAEQSEGAAGATGAPWPLDSAEDVHGHGHGHDHVLVSVDVSVHVRRRSSPYSSLKLLTSAAALVGSSLRTAASSARLANQAPSFWPSSNQATGFFASSYLSETRSAGASRPYASAGPGASTKSCTSRPPTANSVSWTLL